MSITIRSLSDAYRAGLRGDKINERLVSKKIDYTQAKSEYARARADRTEAHVKRNATHDHSIVCSYTPKRYQIKQDNLRLEYCRWTSTPSALTSGLWGWQHNPGTLIPDTIGAKNCPVYVIYGDYGVKITVDDCGEWVEYSRRHRYYHCNWQNRRIEIYAINHQYKTAKIVKTYKLDTLSKSTVIQVLISDTMVGQYISRQKSDETKNKKMLKNGLHGDGPIVCYKMVAKQDNKLVSVFDGKTEYEIGNPVNSPITGTDNICENGGIFVHQTEDAARKQGFPETSAAWKLPRVLLRGICWGNKNVNEKIAAEWFVATKIMA